MTKRLFVSVDLSDRIQAAIADAREPFEGLPGLRLTDPEQTHVTLYFLGEVPAEELSAVQEAITRGLDDADVPPFRARFGGFGVFPEFEYISVIWIGVRDGATELERLHRSVAAELEQRGFEGDDHEFTPHVTFARMDHAGAKDDVQRLVSDRDPDVGTMEVDSVALTESTLTSAGPAYETIERFQLEPPSR